VRGTPFSFEGFTGGLNTQADPYQLDQSEAREAMNVVSTQRGSIRKRNGSILVNETAPNVALDSATWVRSSVSFVTSGSGKIYSMTTPGGVEEIGSGLTAGVRLSVVEAPLTKESGGQGPVYLTNGTDVPLYWPGTGLTVGPWTGAAEVTIGETKVPCYEDPVTKKHVPNGKYMVFAGNRIWMTGISSDPSAVWFSETVSIGEGGEQADPSFWPKTNVVRFDSSDGHAITGIGTVGPYILIFKEAKTWVIYNLNTGENRRISSSVGCVAHRSIVESAHGTFFLSADQGVCITNGSTISEVSQNVRPTVLEANTLYRHNAAGVYFENHYYLSYPGSGSETNNRTLDYDTQLKSWWLHDLAGNQWTIVQVELNPTQLMMVPPGIKKGLVRAFVPNVYTDSGENYTGNGTLGAYWFSAWDPWGFYIQRHRVKAPFVKKRIRQIWFAGEGSIVPLLFKNFHVGGRQEPAVAGSEEIATSSKVPTDFSAVVEKWGEGSGVWGEEFPGTETLWGGEVSIGQARIYAAGVCNVASIGWGNDSDQPFTVDTYMTAISFRKS
jgi:hypothetical protein